jgi:hypothetical protein
MSPIGRLTRYRGPAPPIVRLHADGRIFRALDGTPWRWKGVSAFKLLARWAAGENVDPFLEAFAGFNTLRVWPYVEWGPESWNVTDPATINAFIADMNRRGWYVELTLLTDDAPSRLEWAKALVPKLGTAQHAGLFLEGGNEPTTNKNIDTPALRPALEASGYLFASGDYEDSYRAYGTHLVAHTARTKDWPRKAHDLMEYHNGGGPNAPSDPAHKNPPIGDEPGKVQDVGTILSEWRAYFGTCSILGAGATVHLETGKYAQPPTADERPCIAAALEGLDAFPCDAPNGPYQRIVEPNQPDYGRTYVVGNCMTRCQQPGTQPPAEAGSGWTALDPDGVLFRR